MSHSKTVGVNRPGSLDLAAAAFEEQRARLVALAYRMLGSRADAEDAVQEAWLRLARQDLADIDNLAGWLTTVVGRLCVDVLRARSARPEAWSDHRLPALVVTADGGSGSPEDDALLGESVGLALLVVLDTLSPAERLAFVLHDTFAVPFEEIGQIIDRSADAAKMAASRARRKIQGGARRSTGERQQQRAAVDAFLAAARNGNFVGLLRVLDPDVVWRTHTARGVVLRRGATEVAGRARRGSRARGTAQPVLVNGEPGIVARATNGKLLSVMACTVVDGRIVEIESVTDPEQLASVEVSEHPD